MALCKTYRPCSGGWCENLACAPAELEIGVEGLGGAPGRNRTCCLMLRRHALYPVSYRRTLWNSLTSGLGPERGSAVGIEAGIRRVDWTPARILPAQVFALLLPRRPARVSSPGSPACCLEPPQRHQRPDDLDHAERPGAGEEAIRTREEAPDRESEDEPRMAMLQGVHDHHAAHRADAGEGDRAHVGSPRCR